MRWFTGTKNDKLAAALFVILQIQGILKVQFEDEDGSDRPDLLIITSKYAENKRK